MHQYQKSQFFVSEQPFLPIKSVSSSGREARGFPDCRVYKILHTQLENFERNQNIWFSVKTLFRPAAWSLFEPPLARLQGWIRTLGRIQ